MIPLLLPRLALVLAAVASTASDEPALSIDAAPVSFEEFAAWLIPFQGETYVPNYVDLLLLERAASDEGVDLTRERLSGVVTAQIARRVELAFGGDVDAWRAELERLGQTEAEHRASQELIVYGETLVTELVARRRNLGEDAVRAAWERRYGPGGRSPELRWIHLSVPPPAAPPGAPKSVVEELTRAARAKVEGEALALRARVVAGADFAELARERSDDQASRASGGVPPADFDLGKQARAAVQELAIGEVSAPIYGRGGFNLLLVVGEEITPFASVAAELEAMLRAEPTTAGESNALLAELRAAVSIEVLPEFGRLVRGAADDPTSWRMERPVLRVGERFVSRAELAGWLCAARGKPYVRTFAEMRLIEAAAGEAGVELSTAEVERRVYDDLERTLEQHFDGERERWVAQLAANGQSEASWLRMARIRTRNDLLAERLMIARRAISEDDLRAAWEQRFGPGGRSPDVRYLLRVLPEPEEGTITTQEELERYEARARAEAVELLESLRARIGDGEDFATLAELFSQDASTRDRGGRPAGRFELHTWPVDIQQAIGALRPGGVSPPIALGYQYYLFQLVGVRVVPFEEVRAELLRELRDARPSMVDVRSFTNALYVEHDVRALPGLMARRPGPAR